MPELFAKDFVHTVLLVIITWASGKIFRELGMSEIIANVATGVLFGPAGALPLLDDSNGLKLLKFIGVWGVAFLLLGSGIESSFQSLREVGFKAVGVGVIGTIGPYILGILTYMCFGEESMSGNGWKSAIGMGTVLAPTSIAVPLTVFVTYRYVSKNVGQIVLNAAVLDDIFSIILLSVLDSLAKPQEHFGRDLSLLILYNILMIVVSGLIGHFIVPNWGVRVFHGISARLGDVHRDVLQVACVFTTMISLSFVASRFDCDLLGAFCAGLLFCELPRSETLWHHQTKAIVKWMVRIFFTFNVGCGVPAKDLISWEACWKGIILFLIPALGGKLLCGIFNREDFLMTGIAMSGRGEFAFVVLNTARKFISPVNAAALVWALLLTMIVCPLVLSILIKKQIQCRTGIRFLKIEIQTKRKRDLALEINEFMHEEEFNVQKIRYDTTPNITTIHYTIRSQNCINERSIEDLRHRLKDLLDDECCRLKIMPLEDIDVAEALDVEDPEEESHLFLLKWTIPTSSRKAFSRRRPNSELSTQSLENKKPSRITPWILLDKIDRELDKHNLVITCAKIKSIDVATHQTQFEAVLRVVQEGLGLHAGASFAEDKSVQELEKADPISKMGMHVLKKILHMYHVSGITDFNQNRNSSEVAKL